MGRKRIITVLILLFVVQNLGVLIDSTNSFVSSVETTRHKRSGKEGLPFEINAMVPQIYQMQVKSIISNRFARTTVISKVKNLAHRTQEATFSVVLPETAFISGFIMEVDGKNYTAYVKEKEEAKRTYDQAVAGGFGAAHVAVSARDSNRFTVSAHVEPETKAAFYLTYEELLKRDEGHYELVINLHPGQPVKDLSVEVVITESRKITDLKTPPMRSGNELGSDNAELDPRADLEILNDTAAIVRFVPNVERQKQLAHLLGTDEKQGLTGQFVVQYDVERDPKGGEVLIQDGYFVHFFAPSEMDPLPKHVVFVLDTSGSMWGQKIEQLKQAMHKILEQLHSNDLLSLVEFNTNAKVWDLNNPDTSVWYSHNSNGYTYWGAPGPTADLSSYSFPKAYSVNVDNIKKAKDTVLRFASGGGTDIHSALKVGLHLVELEKEQNRDNVNRQPMIVFLTDGEPTIGITSISEIFNKIAEYNSGIRKSPIFALSFGEGADKNFLQKLALRNSGFSKHIYEAADASLQLEDFYKQISSPLLANVTFKYEPSTASLTETEFPIHFGGSEIVVAGRFRPPYVTVSGFFQPEVEAWNGHSYVMFRPNVQRSVSSIERLWAYLTVKHLLEKKEVADRDSEEIKKKALDLALKYSFVTPVSSLVVVKPNLTHAVDTETAERPSSFIPGIPGSAIGLSAPPMAQSGFGIGGYPDSLYMNAPATSVSFSAPESARGPPGYGGKTGNDGGFYALKGDSSARPSNINHLQSGMPNYKGSFVSPIGQSSSGVRGYSVGSQTTIPASSVPFSAPGFPRGLPSYGEPASNAGGTYRVKGDLSARPLNVHYLPNGMPNYGTGSFAGSFGGSFVPLMGQSGSGLKTSPSGLYTSIPSSSVSFSTPGLPRGPLGYGRIAGRVGGSYGIKDDLSTKPLNVNYLPSRMPSYGTGSFTGSFNGSFVPLMGQSGASVGGYPSGLHTGIPTSSVSLSTPGSARGPLSYGGIARSVGGSYGVPDGISARPLDVNYLPSRMPSYGTGSFRGSSAPSMGHSGSGVGTYQGGLQTSIPASSVSGTSRGPSVNGRTGVNFGSSHGIRGNFSIRPSNMNYQSIRIPSYDTYNFTGLFRGPFVPAVGQSGSGIESYSGGLYRSIPSNNVPFSTAGSARGLSGYRGTVSNVGSSYKVKGTDLPDRPAHINYPPRRLPSYGTHSFTGSAKGFSQNSFGGYAEPNRGVVQGLNINSRTMHSLVDPSYSAEYGRPLTIRSISDLISRLPWLRNVLNNNGIIILPAGNYKLGLNQTFSDAVACRSPYNVIGHCTLLHLCPQVHSLLTSVQIFANHFCILRNEYAGVCCPNSP